MYTWNQAKAAKRARVVEQIDTLRPGESVSWSTGSSTETSRLRADVYGYLDYKGVKSFHRVRCTTYSVSVEKLSEVVAIEETPSIRLETIVSAFFYMGWTREQIRTFFQLPAFVGYEELDRFLNRQDEEVATFDEAASLPFEFMSEDESA